MNPKLQLGIVIGSTAVLSSGVTWSITHAVLRRKYEKISNEEIAQVKEGYAKRQVQNEYDTPGEALAAIRQNQEEEASDNAQVTMQQATDIIENHGYASSTAEVVSVFDDPARLAALQRRFDDGIDYESDFMTPAEWDAKYRIPTADDTDEEDNDTVENVVDGYEEAPIQRNRSQPYHISKEEFFDQGSEFSDYSKLTVTYYEGDDTLTDDADRPVPNIEDVIGRDSLERFGDESEDRNISYVRNERLQADYEVVLDPDEYTAVVLGYRNDRQPVRRMRDDE